MFEDMCGRYELVNTWVCADDLAVGMQVPNQEGILLTLLGKDNLVSMLNKDLGFIPVGYDGIPNGYIVDFSGTIPIKAHGSVGRPPIMPYQLASNSRFKDRLYFNLDEYGEDYEYTYNDRWLKRKAYNLEVEDYHTYFLGEAGIWVHNKSKKPA